MSPCIAHNPLTPEQEKRLRSDTPRTDAAVINESELHDQGYLPSPYVYADFARTLEREIGVLGEQFRVTLSQGQHWAHLAEQLAKDNKSLLRERELIETHMRDVTDALAVFRRKEK